MSSSPPEAVAKRHDPGPEQAAERERGISPVELLWDLVFVFAITQVTTLLGRELSWGGFARAMLVLALVWWAWSAFVWAANAQEDSSPALRRYLLPATVCVFITGLSLPRAFAGEGMLFATSYGAVRLLHLGLYADASRKGSASWTAITGFAITVLIGMALLVAGALVGGGWRIALWAIAVAIDYAGPAWFTRERLRTLQQVAVAHFAERYSTFVIICLGESIVAIGVGAGSGNRHLTVALVAAVALGLLVTVGMWWAYFDRLASSAEQRLREHEEPVLAAADAYSYVHLLIVAGIILFAVGVKLLAHGNVTSPLEEPGRLTLCGGIALYLAGNLGFAWRLQGKLDHPKATAIVGAIVLYLLSARVAGYLLCGALAALLAGLAFAEGRSPQEGD